MSEPYCDREEEVAAAASAGACDAAILDHAGNCQVCSEVLLVGRLLGASAQLSAQELNGVPDATVVWRKAQALTRKQALRRATLPIRTARIAACVFGAIVVPLWIARSGWLRTYVPQVWLGHASSAYQPWSAGSSASLLMLTITAATMLIGLSSWYMLREE
jgi:hypothetical protein